MENYIKNLIRNIWTKWTSTRNQVHRYQTNKHLSKTQSSHKTAEMLQALSLFLQQHYQFRFNLLTEGTEFKEQGKPDSPYRPFGLWAIPQAMFKRRKSPPESFFG